MNHYLNDPRIRRLLNLCQGALTAPPGRGRIALALLMGACCHIVFAAAILSMIYAMYFGLSRGLGNAPYPWAFLANFLLIIQFPLGHSLLLRKSGSRFLARLIPGRHGGVLSTSTYAIVASTQLLALFWLWTPSGILWWRADGAVLLMFSGLYLLTFVFLGKAIFDAGIELQSGALGWLSLLADRAPRFPPMPTVGLFRRMRQPIYLAFACTLWTVPTWTPDQLALAVLWTAYCVFAPRLKERRYEQRYGEKWNRYRARVPYMRPGASNDLP
ncbi:MAG: isoprenylcysteine carboxylmethyltransferase family protein [Pseudomonadota bacterium]